MSDKSPVYLVDLPDGGSASLTMDQINRLVEKNPNWPNPEPEKARERGKGLNPNTSAKKMKRLKKK